ncbi:MAG: PQQ-dependent sugar dehydrogenase [Pyrinomonadaceae bacterium]
MNRRILGTILLQTYLSGNKTERPGCVRIIESGRLRPEPLYTAPDAEPSSESGLMDVSIHPDFASNGFVYLAYAYYSGGKHVKVVRYKYMGGKLADPKIIVENMLCKID